MSESVVCENTYDVALLVIIWVLRRLATLEKSASRPRGCRTIVTKPSLDIRRSTDNPASGTVTGYRFVANAFMSMS